MRFRIETDPPTQITVEWVKGASGETMYNIQHFPSSANYAANYWTMEELLELRRLLVALDVARVQYERETELPF